MKTVVVTGSDGFIGRNLVVSLQLHPGIRILCYDVQSDPATLKSLLDQADFVFHLAGVNRPQDPLEFQTGNIGLTVQICSLLAEGGKKTPILFSSSIQATLDHPYGASKKAAEDALFTYGCESGTMVHIFRLPNVFGKWGRPNYNSGVATFCHNIANGQPILVNDRSVVMNLVYIDDVVRAFIDLLDGRELKQGEFSLVEPVYTITLGEIVDLIYSFSESRKKLGIPNMADPFVKKLYSTYLSYLPTDNFSYLLTMHADERGSFTEFIKTPDRGQVSVNISKPGITKGNHWHHTKNEKFLVVSGRGVISFRRVTGDEVIEYPVSGDRLEVVDIPTGYTHSITNTGETDLVTVMWCNEIYDPGHPDTYFENLERIV